MNKFSVNTKLIKDISANTVQTIVTQIFGLLIFYFTSRYLSKDEFGQFNWSMAVGSTIIAIFSFGLDLVFVKRVAAAQDILVISGVHFFHTVVIGVLLVGISFIINNFVPSFTTSHPFFFYVFICLTISNMANSFKLCLNGLESYKHLAIISLCVNVLKFAGIIFLYFIGHFNILNVILIYTVTAILEFLLGYYFLSINLPAVIKPLFRIDVHKLFIIESLPQLGVVLFDSALARIDWILLGIISTAAITAEYSFAYKIFELSKLPLLIISPVLLTRLSKMYANNNVPTQEQNFKLIFFFKVELFLIMIIPLLLVCVWSPLVDFLTNDKYGKVNETCFWVLALCIPMHAIINFLWTVAFVKGKLKSLMFITISASVMNIIGNLILIPLFGGLGAALAFLLSTLFQLILYFKYLRNQELSLHFSGYILGFINAIAAVLICKLLFNNIFLAAILSLIIYFIFAVLTKQIELKKLRTLFE